MRFWIYLFISVFCKCAVPIFFCISGALLLGKQNERIKDLWLRRIFKVLSLLILFSFVYYLGGVLTSDRAFNIKTFFMRLYSSDWNYSFWYLYLYIAFLISIPFLRAMVSKLDKNSYYYMISLVLFFSGVLPVLEYLLWNGEYTMNSNLKLTWLCSNIVIFPCLGYFLHNNFEIKTLKRITYLWVVNIFSIILSCYMTYRKVMITGECSENTSQAFHNSFVLINCCTIFISAKWLFEKYNISEWIIKLINSLGSCTLGIYLLHVFLLNKVTIFSEVLWTILCNKYYMNPMISELIVCFGIMMSGYILTLLLKKVPIIKLLI